MTARLISVSPSKPEAAAIKDAAAALEAGQLVAFPTETVYGLGADARSDKAVAKIFASKGRPSFNPLIIHGASLEQLEKYADFNDMARELALHFWPGPLTLVLPRKEDSGISLLASAGLPALALRVPSHPVAQALLRKSGLPVAAPSANKSGHISATTPQHVLDELGDKIDVVLGAGRCTVGLESTIIDLTTPTPTLLRPGGVPREPIERITGKLALTASKAARPNSPGQLESHYAPNAAVRLNATHVEADEALLAFGPDMGMKGGVARMNLSPNGDLHEAAANLFSMLHELDKSGARAIAVMPIPEEGLGLAINDRLTRAAAPRPEA